MKRGTEMANLMELGGFDLENVEATCLRMSRCSDIWEKVDEKADGPKILTVRGCTTFYKCLYVLNAGDKVADADVLAILPATTDEYFRMTKVEGQGKSIGLQIKIYNWIVPVRCSCLCYRFCHRIFHFSADENMNAICQEYRARCLSLV
jgi:hypothetical protein